MGFGPPIRPQPLTRDSAASPAAPARTRRQARRPGPRSLRLSGTRLTLADRTRSGPPRGPGATGTRQAWRPARGTVPQPRAATRSRNAAPQYHAGTPGRNTGPEHRARTPGPNTMPLHGPERAASM